MLRLIRRSGPSGMRYETVTEGDLFSLDQQGILAIGREATPLADWQREELVTFQGDRLWHARLDGELYVEVGQKRLHCPRGVSFDRVLRERPWAGPVDIDQIRVQRSDRGQVIAVLDLRAPDPRWRLEGGGESAELTIASAGVLFDQLAAEPLEEAQPRSRPSQLSEGQKLVNLSP